MSCLMMNEKPLASLADWIAAQLNHGFNGFGMEAPSALYNALSDCTVAGRFDENKIYLKLYALNFRAYDCRYSRHDEPITFTPPDPYKPNTVHQYPVSYNGHWTVAPWHYQIAKRLSFLLYQCSEDATRNDELYLALAQLRRNLYCFIVDQSDAWQALPWME